MTDFTWDELVDLQATVLIAMHTLHNSIQKTDDPQHKLYLGRNYDRYEKLLSRLYAARQTALAQEKE